MKISIICASKNEQHDIHLLLDSYLMFRDNDTELIIVDDSNDNTRNTILNYINTKPNSKISLIKGDNMGCCLARNKGILKSSGEYICFMTADSFFSKNYFKNSRMIIEKNKFPDAIMPLSKISKKHLDSLFSCFIDFLAELKYQNKTFLPKTAQGYLVKKESALKVGLIEAKVCLFNVCRDYTLVENLQKSKYNVIRADEIETYHKPPTSFLEFYHTQMQRGMISGGTAIFYKNKNRFNFVIMSILRSIFHISLKSLISAIFYIYKNQSKYGIYYRLRFSVINWIRWIAFSHGEFLAIFTTIKKMSNNGNR